MAPRVRLGMYRVSTAIACVEIALASFGPEHASFTRGKWVPEASLIPLLHQRRALSTGNVGLDPGCPVHPSPVGLPSPLPGSLATALASVNASLVASLNSTTIPGAALSIWYRGQPLFESAVGLADKSNTVPTSVSGTLFRIGSVSKVFPAALLYLLAEQGMLDIDDPISKYAPAFHPLNPFDSSNITFRQLASQMSGLQRETPPFLNETADVIDAVSQTYLILPPGQLPSYSNLGFALLGHILAEYVYANSISGSSGAPSFPDLVNSSITAPLGMQDTGFNYSSESVASRLAVGYNAQGLPVPFADLGWWYPAGSMYSSMSDLNRLATGLMGAAGVNVSAPQAGAAAALALSAGRAREMLSPLYWNRDGLSLFGTPWEMRTSADYLVISKGGDLPGYSTQLTLVPELALSVAVAWNGNVDEMSWMQSAMDILVPALETALVPLQPAPAFNPGPNPSDYVGTYELQGTEVIVSVQQGFLVWYNSVLGVQVALDWFKDDIFRVEYPDSAFPCQLGELEALRYQYVFFTRSSSSGGAAHSSLTSQAGPVTTTSLPGLIPGAVWTKSAL